MSTQPTTSPRQQQWTNLLFPSFLTSIFRANVTTPALDPVAQMLSTSLYPTQSSPLSPSNAPTTKPPPKIPPPRRLHVAVSGLGRMGARHAVHFLERTPRAELVAVFTPDEEELAWARQRLEPWGVTLYTNYEEMLKHEGLEAVVVSTATSVHATQSIAAIKRGLHVLCEKPLSTSVEESQSIVDAAKTRPHLKVLCGFSRRFDSSYRYAWERVDDGYIGRPSIFRSQTCNKLGPSSRLSVDDAQFNGGIFVDCSIHDIDLALWFFGQNSIVKSVYATGITAVEPELRKYGDVDNGIGIVELWNGKIAYFYSSRMMAAGQHDMTEIIGTEGKITINGNPMANLVEMSEAKGVRREIPQDYYGRFEEAFVREANEFTECCLDDKKLPFKLTGAVQAVKIACALYESLNSGRKIEYDEIGRRVEKASL